MKNNGILDTVELRHFVTYTLRNFEHFDVTIAEETSSQVMDHIMNLKAFVRTCDLNYFGKTTARLITGLVFVAVLFLIFSFQKIFDETSRISSTGQYKYVDLHEYTAGSESFTR